MNLQDQYIEIIEKHMSKAQSEFSTIALTKILMHCQGLKEFSHEQILQYISNNMPKKLAGVYAECSKLCTCIKMEMRALYKKNTRKTKETRISLVD